MTAAQIGVLTAHLDRMNAELDIALSDLLSVQLKVSTLCNEIKTARHIIAEVAIMPETARSTLSGHETLNHTDKPPRNA